MSGGGRGGGEEEEVLVVHMEDAVKMLVEHLVKPVLPRGAVFGAAQGERHMAPDKQLELVDGVMGLDVYVGGRFGEAQPGAPRSCLSLTCLSRPL
ncbi:hypothetical protein ZWY2020_016740 [Hordeum vulgare]|nr:hypothetical protein ZWY2020_016740 [Hordeum vulgare]